MYNQQHLRTQTKGVTWLNLETNDFKSDVINCGHGGVGWWGGGGGGGKASKPRHPIMLSQMQGHNPKGSTLRSSQQERVPGPPLPPTPQPPPHSAGAASRLSTACAPHHWLLQRLELCPRSGGAAVVLGGRATRPSGRPSQWESRPGQERVGLAPAGSSGWGGRGVSSCYTFCESGAHGRKRKQSRPTHPLTHECERSTDFNCRLCMHKCKHTPIVFPTWQDTFKASASKSPFYFSRSLHIHTRKAAERLWWKDMRGQRKPTNL